MKTRSQTGFAALQTEGAILPADLLRRIAEGDSSLGGLDPASYHLPAGERLSEAVSRSWSRLQGSWAAFKAAGERLPEADAGTSLTRERWLLPLFQELGYGRLTPSKPITIGEKSYGVSHGWQHSPLHLVSFRLDLDKRQPGAAGASRSSPHSLVQELLNRSEEHLWGIVSNGRQLRLLRDNASLSRQAFVEFDLEAIFDGELYADFALLWLLCHQSRVEGDEPESCWLEKWSKAAKQQGTRALDRLRTGVEEAITALGIGLLVHPANGRLRDRLQGGNLDLQDLYRELLRHVYRLLFLFVAEDRGLLHPPSASAAAKERYSRFFSTQRLRQT
ncbi:MAG TPA: type II DNA modification enzyme, partial [Thermoanaerobaculia bacterium]|nr:type II DNA modification enzyme [Thermoanaerobaculia bacterium]